MNKKDDFLIRATRNKKRQSNKRRNIAIASTLSVMCIAAMAGVYRMESHKNTKEELLVNWEDNATSDTTEKVKVNLGTRQTEKPSDALNAGMSAYDTAKNIVDNTIDDTNTSLLEADISENQNNNISPDNLNGIASESGIAGEDAVEAADGNDVTTDDTTQASANNSIAVQFGPDDSLNWPVQGSVLLDYSMDSTTYFPTLDQYKYNPAVVIQSDVGTQVYAAADGIVESIVETQETGLTVTMNIGGGYQLVYGQLKNVNFSTGSYIKKGEVVGSVADPTKYYSVEGSNLYFQMLENGVPTDPVDYLKEGIITE